MDISDIVIINNKRKQTDHKDMYALWKKNITFKMDIDMWRKLVTQYNHENLSILGNNNNTLTTYTTSNENTRFHNNIDNMDIHETEIKTPKSKWSAPRPQGSKQGRNRVKTYKIFYYEIQITITPSTLMLQK